MEKSNEEVQRSGTGEGHAGNESQVPRKRTVPAELYETTPENQGLFHWILASPMLLFMAWTWTDIFAYYSPIPIYWIDLLLGLIVLLFAVVLPFGVGGYWLVTSLPRLFGHAGWDVQPLEPVAETELPMVRYQYNARHRAKTDWRRTWMRAAQGWVYLEIAAIMIGGVLIVPAFLSATEFGFGQPQ